MKLVKPRDATPKEFCQWLKDEIELNRRAMLGRMPVLVLYSGPALVFKKTVEALFGRSVSGNKPRGREVAKLFFTNILDDTPIGTWLLAQDFRGYFDSVCGSDPVLIDTAIGQVWATVSDELVRHAKGKAFTSVCGADPERVFLRHELPQMLDETGLDSVNHLPMNLVRDFSILGDKESFFQICKFELLSLHTRARLEADPVKAKELRAIWQEQRCFFQESLKECKASALQMSRNDAKMLRLRRRAIRAGYDFQAIKRGMIDDATQLASSVVCTPVTTVFVHP